MDLQQLKYFVTSAEEGSLTKAAAALYTTQPHVSQVIKSLESELGISLFERSSSGIKLTESGEKVYFHAQNVLKNAGLLMDISKTASEKSLRIAANPSSSLAFYLGDFFHSHKEEGLMLQYTECGIEQMMELLHSHQYELGLLFVPLDRIPALSHLAARHDLTYTQLRTSDLVVHAGKKNRFYGRKEIAPEELSGCECIQLQDDYFSVEDLLLDTGAYRLGEKPLRKVIRTNSDHLMIRALQQTELCNIGSYWVKNVYGEYSFSAALIKGFEDRVSFGYLHSENRALSEEAETFLSGLKDILSKDMEKES